MIFPEQGKLPEYQYLPVASLFWRITALKNPTNMKINFLEDFILNAVSTIPCHAIIKITLADGEMTLKIYNKLV